MSSLHVLIPPIPRGVYLTPRIVAELAVEWASLPEPAQAILEAMRLGPEPSAYTTQLVIGDNAGIRRELKAAYRSAAFRTAWLAWAGDEPLDNVAAPLVLGLAVCGTINARVSERARMAHMSIQRVIEAENGVPMPRPMLEPLHLGDGIIDMTRLQPRSDE